jgi:hypothetical protein
MSGRIENEYWPSGNLNDGEFHTPLCYSGTNLAHREPLLGRFCRDVHP